MPSPYLQRAMRHGQPGFSLLEMLAAVAILGLLLALVFPMASRSMKSAKAAQSLANLKEIGSVLNIYAGDNNGVYPYVWDYSTTNSWIATIWPYVYQKRFPGTTPDALKGSIFYTPLSENGTTARTYGMNAPLELKYPSRIYAMLLPKPSAVAISGDVKTSGNFRVDQINYRNNGLANVLFLDGHTEAVKPESVPTNTVSMFWTGVPAN